MTGRTYQSRCSRARLGSVADRHDELLRVLPRMQGGEQQPPHGLEFPGEPELPIELAGPLGRTGMQLSGGHQYPECDRQIESSALLRQLGGSEADGDAAGRKCEPGVQQCRAYPLLTLLDDGGWKSDQAKGREPAREAHLDLYQRSLQPELTAAGHPRHGHGSRCSGVPPVSAARCGSAPLTLGRHGVRAPLECGDPRVERFEQCTRALENPRLSIELVATYQIELAQPLAQHGAEVALEVRLHAAQCRGHALEQPACELIDSKCIHSSKASACSACPESGQRRSRRLQYGAAPPEHPM